jgi:hypothetical protein
MTRLTKAIKHDILENFKVKKIKPKTVKINEAIHKILLDLFKVKYKEVIALSKSVEKESPLNLYLTFASNFYVTSRDLLNRNGEERITQYHNLPFKILKRDYEIPCLDLRNDLTDNNRKVLEDEIVKLRALDDNIETIKNLLDSVTTVKKLTELMPAIEKYLPSISLTGTALIHPALLTKAKVLL